MPEPVEGDVEPGDGDRALKGLPGTPGSVGIGAFA
jgi:hypothetical protein